MDQPTIETIRPLVAAVQDEASYVVVTFRCADTGAEFRAEGHWPEDGQIASQAKQAKRTLFGTLRSSIASSVIRSAGSSTLGSIGGQAAANLVQNTGNSYGQPAKHSDRQRDGAILDAFTHVQGNFRWDDGRKAWLAASAARVAGSPFSDHLTANPVPDGYDRDVLVRLLASLVASDATIGDDERASFAAMAPGADLDALAARRAPGAVDFEETKLGGSRESILLLGWAVALSDELLAPAEEALLATTATGLGIADQRAAELKQIAQRHIVDEAIATLAAAGTDPDDLRAQVEALGDKIGLGADEAARAVIRWSKRGN